jgi:cytoskeletal protein CcmA (bactofilin family)
MPPAKVALKSEPTVTTRPRIQTRIVRSNPETAAAPSALPHDVTRLESPKLRPVAVPSQPNSRRENASNFQARVPPIIGEVTFRGWLPVDGVISGQLSANRDGFTIRQRPRNGSGECEPELDGEIRFKDLLRVNGYVAGRILSEKGTLIVATEARVDAEIEVGVAVISGTVNGNVIGHERVELSPGAVIMGNISTNSLAVRPGAFFHGDCCVWKEKNGDK